MPAQETCICCKLMLPSGQEKGRRIDRNSSFHAIFRNRMLSIHCFVLFFLNKREKKEDIGPSLILLVIANKIHALYCYEGQICPVVKLRAAEMRGKNVHVMTH